MNVAVDTTSPTRLLRGHIQNLHKTRRNQDFFFSASDRARIGATAVAAGLAGLGGIATGLGGMALDTTEEADFLEFDLDGKSVRAWVWQSVFQEGDEVEIVAEQIGDIWQGYGIRRACDRIVALHPHCSRGRYAHYKVAIKLWLKVGIGLLVIMNALTAVIAAINSVSNWHGMILMWLTGGIGVMAVLAFIAYRIASKMMGFVRLAEGIFTGFGWIDVKNIDLPAITKRAKKPGDPAALGVLYFWYPDERAAT